VSPRGRVQDKSKNQLKEGGSVATFFATDPFLTNLSPTDAFLPDPSPPDLSSPDLSPPDPSPPDFRRPTHHHSIKSRQKYPTFENQFIAQPYISEIVWGIRKKMENQCKPVQTCANQCKPVQTSANLCKPVQTSANLCKPV
jgi:hypothetical protein